MNGWQNFVGNLTSSSSSNIFKVVPLGQLITSGVAAPILPNADSTGISCWKIITPSGGVNLDNNQTTNTWYGTGDVCLPIPLSQTTGSNINPAVANVSVLFVTTNPTYTFTLPDNSWQENFVGTNGWSPTFFFVQNRYALAGTNGLGTCFGDIVDSGSFQNGIFISTTGKRVVAAVYNVYLVNLTPCSAGTCQDPNTGAQIANPNSTAGSLTFTTTNSASPVLFPPYEYMSNLANQGTNTVTNIYSESQVNASLVITSNTVVWTVARANPYAGFIAMTGNNTTFFSGNNIDWLFKDIILPTQMSLCCATGGGVSATTNCGIYNGANANGTAAVQGQPNTTPCGQQLNTIGLPAFNDSNWLLYLHSSPGQFDTIFYSALTAAQNNQNNQNASQNTTQTSSSTTLNNNQFSLLPSNPIFGCAVAPQLDPNLPSSIISVLSQLQAYCVNPFCNSSGYKPVNTLTQPCAFNIQNCIANQGITNLGQLNGTTQLNTVINCTQSQGQSATTPNPSNTSTTTNTTIPTNTSTSATVGGTGVTASSSTPSTSTTPSTTSTTSSSTTSSTTKLSTAEIILIVIAGIIVLIIFILIIRSLSKSKTVTPPVITTQYVRSV